MKIRVVIDRIEKDLAVMEARGFGQILWPAKLLPKGTRPGNIISFSITKNPAAEKRQRKKIEELQKRMNTPSAPL